MDIKITSNVENKMLNRKEIRFQAVYAGKTPSKDELRELLCKTLNLNPSTTVIVNVDQTYGAMSSNVLAHSYAKAQDMSIEPKHFEKRKSKKGAGDAAEAQAPEQKKEEKKEAPAEKEEKAHEKKEHHQKEKDEAPKEEEKKE